MTETIGLMEPLLPPENASELSDLALDLASRGPVRMGFPIDVVERWFPLLYPDTRR